MAVPKRTASVGDYQIEDAKATKALVLRVSFTAHDFQYPVLTHSDLSYKYLPASFKKMPTHVNSSSTNTILLSVLIKRDTLYLRRKAKKFCNKLSPSHVILNTQQSSTMHFAWTVHARDHHWPKDPPCSRHQQKEVAAGSLFSMTRSR